MLKVNVNGKNRIVRDRFIDWQTDSDLECIYRNHRIRINEQETGGFYKKERKTHPSECGWVVHSICIIKIFFLYLYYQN